MAGLAWIAAVIILLAYEFYAIATGKETLSARIWRMEKWWPFFGTLVGLIIGGLLVHFFWIPAGCDPTKGF